MDVRKTGVLLAAVFVFALMGSFTACTPKGSVTNDFSAEIVTKNNAGTFEGKIYSAKDKTRMDMPQSSVITRLDKNVVWILMPSEKMYIEQPIKPENTAMKPGKLPGETRRELVATEKVNGQNTEKFKITYSAGGKTETIFQWIAKDSGIPIKTSALDGKWSYEYKDIKTGSQNTALFELPKDYAKFTIPPLEE